MKGFAKILRKLATPCWAIEIEIGIAIRIDSDLDPDSDLDREDKKLQPSDPGK